MLDLTLTRVARTVRTPLVALYDHLESVAIGLKRRNGHTVGFVVFRVAP